LFADNDDIVFADVNLKDAAIRNGPNGGSLGAGKGGWPTIRYFNKETGYDGGEYQKVTDDAMCTELASGTPHLKNYIEGYSGMTKTEL